jgi:hypothetical protein
MDEKTIFLIKKLNKEKIINEWVHEKYKEKPFYIYGLPGTGKSTLAKYILKDFTTIFINIDFYKSTDNNIELYLEKSIQKKSIIMMFNQNKNLHKAIIFDDLNFIQTNDKKTFQSIVNFSKKKLNNHPIIYISDHIKHKMIHSIYEKCFPININLSKKDYQYIVKKYYLTKNDKNINIKSLVEKSEYNFNKIKVNISFFKNNTDHITKKDHNTDQQENLIFDSDIISKSYDEIYCLYSSDYSTKSLNIIENLPLLIFKSKLPYEIKMSILIEIYKLHIIGDTHLSQIYSHNFWDIYYIIVNYLIYFPTILLRKHKINLKHDIIYNHYLSKSIIHTYYSKILLSININYKILSTIYNFLKDNKIDELNNLIKLYKIPLKVVQKFSKYFNISKNDFKNHLKNKQIHIL